MENLKPSLQEHLGQADIGSINSVEPLADGYTSQAYKVESSEGAFVALQLKEDGLKTNTDFLYSFAVLKALEAIDYKYAPRPIYLSEDQSVFVNTLVPGEPLGWIMEADEDSQKRAVGVLVDALLDLRDVSFESCASKYHQLSGEKLYPRTLESTNKKYVIDCYNQAQNAHPDPGLTEWLAPKVAAQQTLVEKLQPGSNAVLVHGDTSEGNILLDKNMKLSLIDWGSGGFNQFPDGWDDFGMGYLMNHVPLFQKFRSDVLELVATRTETPLDKLDLVVQKLQAFLHLADITWAYMMHARAASNEIQDDPVKFMTIAKQRIAYYEQNYENVDFLLQ